MVLVVVIVLVRVVIVLVIVVIVVALSTLLYMYLKITESSKTLEIYSKPRSVQDAPVPLSKEKRRSSSSTRQLYVTFT